jgi:glutamate carboxypeptidase
MALEVMREVPRDAYADLALLLVCDEEWRTAPFAHAERFAGWDAALCFEAGQLAPDGEEAVVVARKAAGTIRVHAHGRAAHAGSAPDKGANALLALAAAAQALAGRHDPTGPDLLSAVPSVIHSGEAFNVVPADGELICDVRARSLDAIGALLEAVPAEVGGARLEAEQMRSWPGMDSRASAGPVIERAGQALGRPLHAGGRGGASDASHFAATIPVTIDGLGPRGGSAHHPDEYVSRASLLPRAEIALAIVAAALESV